MKNNIGIEMAKMRSLIERMEKPLTNYEAMLNEEKHINEAVFSSNAIKRVDTVDEFFDILSKIRNGWFVTAGYVTDAKLSRPKVKRKNPATNRMKGYEDYEGLGDELNSEMSGLMRFTKYTFNWQDPESLGKAYAKYKNDANQIRQKYGLEPIKDKTNDYKEKMNFGGGINVYNGANDEKQGNIYPAQNLAKANVTSTYYSIDTNGNIVNSFVYETLKDHLFKVDPISRDSGANALRKMGTDAKVIEQYLSEINGLGMKYRALVDKGLLFLSATLEGEPSKTKLNRVLWINPNLQKTANDIQVNAQDFVKLVDEMYQDTVAVHPRKKS